MPPRRPTILTIAQACGVTDGTVSRALRGDPRVRAATRERVLAAAQRLGYRPDLAARALKQGRSGLIGVFCDSGPWMLHNGYFGRLLAGLAAAAEADGRRLMLYLPKVEARSDNPAHDQVSLGGLSDLADGRVDAGVVVGGHPPSAADQRALRQSGVPLVWLSPNEAVPGFSQLLSGSLERSRQAGRILAALGHRRVGFFGLFKDSRFQRSSLKGLREGLGPGAKVLEVALEHWDLTDPLRLEPLLDALLKQSPSAVVIANADQASVLQDLLQQRGVRVPKDLSLLSFGPRPSGQRARQPLLSLLDCALDQGGALAYQLVREGLEGRPVRSLTLEWSAQPQGTTLAKV
jgi:DNA-binding LacI/PurR family transcriptional regulator